MKTVTIVAAALVALVAALIWLTTTDAEPRAERTEGRAGSAESLPAIEDSRGRVQGPTGRAPAPTAPGTSASWGDRDAGTGSSEAASVTANLVVEVTEKGTGRPAPGVGLGLHPRPEAGPAGWFERAIQPRAVTDGDGRVEFRHIAARRGTVYMNRVGGDGSFPAERFSLAPGEIGTVRFTVDPDASVHGRVVDEAGLPVSGARIWLSAASGPVTAVGDVVAISGDDGAFRVPYAGRLQSIVAIKEGHAPSLPTIAAVHGGAATEGLELVLGARRGRVIGRVLEPGGHPAAGVYVILDPGFEKVDDPVTGEWTRCWTPAPRAVRTTAEGDFAFEDVRVGRYGLFAREARGPLARTTCEVTDAGVVDVTLELERGAILAGRVVDAAGEPVEGATLSADASGPTAFSGATARSGADGAFELVGVGPGEIVVRIEHPALGARQSETVHAPGGQVTRWDPVLRTPPRLRGTVRSSAQEALPGWRITVSASGSGVGSGTRTDEHGAFELALPEGESFGVEVRPPGFVFGPALLERTGVARDEGTLDLVVPADNIPRGRIEARLVDAAGEPLAGSVVLEITDGRVVFRREVQVPSDGRVVLDRVPDAAGTLRASAAGEEDVERAVPAATSPGGLRDLGLLRF